MERGNESKPGKEVTASKPEKNGAHRRRGTRNEVAKPRSSKKDGTKGQRQKDSIDATATSSKITPWCILY